LSLRIQVKKHGQYVDRVFHWQIFFLKLHLTSSAGLHADSNLGLGCELLSIFSFINLSYTFFILPKDCKYFEAGGYIKDLNDSSLSHKN